MTTDEPYPGVTIGAGQPHRRQRGATSARIRTYALRFASDVDSAGVLLRSLVVCS
jgi:hypothetical protein